MTPKLEAAWSLLAAADPAPWDAYLVVLRAATPQQIMDAYLVYRTEHPEFRRLYRLHVEERERDETEAKAVCRAVVGVLEVAGR